MIPMMSQEYDAPPITGFDAVTGEPILDKEKLGLYDIRLIAFDRAYSNWRKQDGYGAWYEFQRTPTSGRVIVVGSTDWTASKLDVVQTATGNMIDYLLDWTSDQSGDFDGDGSLTVNDLTLLTSAVLSYSVDPKFDLNHDGHDDQSDRSMWIHALEHTHFGDANLDGTFDSRDLLQIMQSGKYEDPITGNSAWTDGDFNGDGETSTSDFVLAFMDGAYVAEAIIANSVPEPTTSPWLLITICLPWLRSRDASRKGL